MKSKFSVRQLSEAQTKILQAASNGGATRSDLHAAVFGHTTAKRGAWQVRKPAEETLTASQRASLSRSLRRLIAAGDLFFEDGLYRTVKAVGPSKRSATKTKRRAKKTPLPEYVRCARGRHAFICGFDGKEKRFFWVLKKHPGKLLLGEYEPGPPPADHMYRVWATVDRAAFERGEVVKVDGHKVWVAQTEAPITKLWEEYHDRELERQLEEQRREAEEQRREAEERRRQFDEFLDLVDEVFDPLRKLASVRAAALKFFGLDKNATPADVNRAFRRLSLTAHPDHGGSAAAFRVLQTQHEIALQAVTKQGK